MPSGPENAANEAEEPVLNLPSVPRPAPLLDRAELLSAVLQAASAAAAGADDREVQRALDGRQFEVRIRFGCRGPREDLKAHSLSWAYEPEERTLRVRALPTILPEDPIVAGMAKDEIETVEGFWIPRPWLLEPVCPRAAAVVPPQVDGGKAAAEGDAGQTTVRETGARDVAAGDTPPETVAVVPKVGIAQFFTATDSRTKRRNDRAYEAVTVIAPDRPLGSQGFNLVLSGRLRALPGTPVISCNVAASDRPPDCIASAEFDRVWIERPGNGEVVAEWGGG